jgi:hypothetical protein
MGGKTSARQALQLLPVLDLRGLFELLFRRQYRQAERRQTGVGRGIRWWSQGSKVSQPDAGADQQTWTFVAGQTGQFGPKQDFRRLDTSSGEGAAGAVSGDGGVKFSGGRRRREDEDAKTNGSQAGELQGGKLSRRTAIARSACALMGTSSPQCPFN